jgi:hypothetical protein
MRSVVGSRDESRPLLLLDVDGVLNPFVRSDEAS